MICREVVYMLNMRGMRDVMIEGCIEYRASQSPECVVVHLCLKSTVLWMIMYHEVDMPKVCRTYAGH